ncbi:MAG: hypothetical protein ACP5G0_10605 [Desulfomonilia bacterium]
MKNVLSMLYRVFFAACFLFIAVVSSSIAAEGVGHERLVKEKCSACHSLGRVCKKLEKKDLPWWQETVARMVKHGADLNQEDVTPVADYLSRLKKGAQPICE